MSTKTFCDSCGDEVTPANAVAHVDDEGDPCEGLLAKLPMTRARRVELRVFATVRTTGDFCRRCVLQALDTLDDRPRAAPEERARLPSPGEFVYRNGVRYKVTKAHGNDPADDLGTYVFTVEAERG